MAKQCPNCRTIVHDVAAPSCDSCGFQFFGGARSRMSFPAMCMRIAGSVFLLAVFAIVLGRLL